MPQNSSSCTEDTLTRAPEDPTAQAGPSTAGLPCPEPRELSGRSRAILKQYFDEEAATVSLPLGHRTVAFTEPQLYRLLRVLTDETLQMSYTTLEKMVLREEQSGGLQLQLSPVRTISKLETGPKLHAHDTSATLVMEHGVTTILVQ